MSPLAIKLARAIFEVGDEGEDRTQRIQFMGGVYPDKETNLGGCCEASLAAFIDATLAADGGAEQ